MQRYIPQNHTPIFGVILTSVLSLLIAAAVGALAYFVSHLIYYFFIFPLVVGMVVSIPYQRIALFFKIRNPLLTVILGISVGMLVAFSFHYVNYRYNIRKDIADIQKEYGVSAERAEAGLQEGLYEETGSTGFIGYMKFRAMVGESFQSVMAFNGVVTHENSFTLSSWQAWASWIIDLILFCVFPVWMGSFLSKRYYCSQADDWYNDREKQIADAPVHQLSRILFHLDHAQFDDLAADLLPEGSLSHPMLEIYQTQTEKYGGFQLVIIKSTGQVKKRKVPRKVEAIWELDESEFSRLQVVVDSLTKPE